MTDGRCNICHIPLDQADDPTTLDCGGDCLRCTAYVAEDPDCIEHIRVLEKEAAAEKVQSIDDRLAALEKTIGLLDETIDLLKRRLDNADRINDSQTRMLRELHRRLFDIEEFHGPRHYSISTRGRGI